jgi:CheY-like chemotaxis protein
MKKVTPGMPGKGPNADVPPAQVLLYVEDDDMNWEVAQMRLAKRYRLHRARNGIEACKLVRELGASLSAVLMDIQLQGSDIDGTALTMLFKGKLPPSLIPPYAVGIDPISAPVVYLTANGVRFEQSELLRTGASFVVSKPVDFVSLAVGLNRLILERRAGIRPGPGGATS